MFDSDHHKWRVLEPCGVHVPLGVAYFWTAIGEKVTEPIARHQQNADIYSAFSERFGKVDHVNYDQIASR